MYQFLQGLTLVDTGRLRAPRQRNPEGGLRIRIYANGEVYPSQELIDKFKLEYTTKENQANSNGFDIVDSTEWTPTATLPRMILFGVTPKSEPKVDLFSYCKYHEDGSPKASVINQGSTNTTLLDLVRAMGYLKEEQKYCDLEIVIQHPLRMQDGIANIPKVITRGVREGEKTYERRENVTFYPVNIPENLTEYQTVPETKETVTN